MEHFCWQPLSVLCGPQSREGKEEKGGVGHMDHAHCEMARATPSLQKSVGAGCHRYMHLFMGVVWSLG